ncbi:MAG TPA: nuclear transport factor 2 family protein [Mycobacteriales bacterium]|nr:nuclear transport factor 2 family protein [Mycobacteriales bacterium]
MISHIVDSWEVRQLVERYASAADRGDGATVASLFTEDGEFVMWLDPESPDPTSHRRGRSEITASIDRIRDYSHTHHTIGSHYAEIAGDRATGETRCEAHHLVGAPPNVRDHVMFAYYLDEFVKESGRWLFKRRELRINWISILSVEN